MKHKISFIIFLFLLVNNVVFAHDFVMHKKINKVSIKEQKTLDNEYRVRLNLTNEQVQILKEIRNAYKKEMHKTVKQMQKVHDDIRDVYLLGLPKYQTNFRTASKKAELVILKQNAQSLKKQYRKQVFEVLDDNQKIEYLKIREENKLDKMD